jgi:hypothetical protein
MGIAGKNA